MSENMAVLTAVIVLVGLLLMQAPVGVAMLTAGMTGIVLLNGFDVANATAAAASYSASAKYALVVIPMYVLLGCLIGNSGAGTQIYRVINAGVTKLRLPGGLPATAVLATSFFSGISGSSAADVAAFGRISVTEMARHGYSRPFAAAVVAAAGTFAVLIPPSIGLVVYAIVAEESIGAMILAGVVPGAISALCLTVFLILRDAWLNLRGRGRTRVSKPAEVVAEELDGVRVAGEVQMDDVRVRWSDSMGIVYGVVLFGIVVGGIYGGFFTATEAGAVGAMAAVLITIASYRSNPDPLPVTLWKSTREAVGATSMLFMLLIGASVLTYLIGSAGVTSRLAAWAIGLDIPPKAFVALILVILLVLGTFLDGLSMILLIVPLAAPVVTELELSGVWFGIMCLKAIEIGLITPPVGLNVYIISGMTRQKAEKVFLAVAPFVVLDLVVTALFFLFPDIVLWLPRRAGVM